MVREVNEGSSDLNIGGRFFAFNRPQFFTIFVVLLILATCMVVYYVKQKKYKINQAPKGFVLMFDKRI